MSGQQGLRVTLHPTPILAISEHHLRISLATSNPAARVFGALLGSQQGRDVDIFNSFEIVVKPDKEDGTGELKVDHGYFVTRRDQFKQVFPTFDFLGWYSVGSAPTAEDTALHQQFLEYNETPLFLQLSPPSLSSQPPTSSSSSSTSPSSSGGKDLPVQIYESTIELVSDVPTSVFVPTPYEVETGEAERVAVDHVSKPSQFEGGEEGGASSLIAALSTQRSALSMLHDRVSVILTYLRSASSGTAKKDPETLRQIAALVASLPGIGEGATEKMGGGEKGEKVVEGKSEFEKEFLTEYNDVLLTNYLAALTKQLLAANELFDKQLLLITSSGDGSSGPGGGGGGGRGTRSGGGGGGGGRRGAGQKHLGEFA
ncbi:hypothetical protein JCM8547_002294 [Rhodosporidiobolus lusitaniae]